MTDLDMHEPLDIANSRAVEALIAAAHEAGLASAYGEALERVRAIAAETSRMVAELEAEEHRTAA